MQKITKTLLSLACFILISGCGFFKWTDQRNQPTTGIEKARKNVQEGKGLGIKGLVGKGNTTYEFNTSNPLWRASLEILDFLPLTTVDYSGGVIITDWYTKNENNKQVKITVRFLNNEIRADSIKIIIHEKFCSNGINCKISETNSILKNELRKSILTKASSFEKLNK